MRKICLKRTEFQSLLKSLGKISDSAIFSLTENGIDALTSSDDNSMRIWSHLDGEFEDLTLNLPSLKKLDKALDMIKDDDVEFILNSNNLEYRGSKVKFTYHLYDDGILTKPKFSIEKFRSLQFSIEFDFDRKFLTELIKNSTITSTDKLYIYTEDDHLVWSLSDKATPNSDSLTIIGSEVDFEMNPFIVKVDNVKVLATMSKDITLRANKEPSLVNMVAKDGNLTLNYIFSSLVA
jgi:hypothetical protein